MINISINEEAIYGLRDAGLRVYIWMITYLPAHGYEVSYREIAAMLQVSPTTVRKGIDQLVEQDYVKRTVSVGITGTYRVIK